jgi:hypothetical protein
MNLNDHYLLSCENPYGELIHNAVLTNIHKNKRFLDFLFKKRIITFKDNIDLDVNEELLSSFYKFLDLFSEKYKDNFDLKFVYEPVKDVFLCYFVVLYPEVTISNSLGKSHFIKDLFVAHFLKVRENNLYTDIPSGGRFSKTHQEIIAGYQQSHLQSNNFWANAPFFSSRFCVGGNTDVSRMCAEFSVEMDWDRYELYLFCVDSMVKWESLEGIPYFKIKDMLSANNGLITSFSKNFADKVVDRLLDNEENLDLDFYVEKSIFRIKDSERNTAFFKEFITRTYMKSNYESVFVHRKADAYNEFYSIVPKVEGSLFINRTDYFILQGRKIFARKIKTKKQKAVSFEDCIIYPKFLNYVFNRIEQRIYQKNVTQNGIKIYNSSNNSNRSSSSNSILV